MGESNEVDLSNDLPELEWMNLLDELQRTSQPQEPLNEKFKRKFWEAPLVPFGCAATVGCLVFGLSAMRKGDSKKQQFFMRGRVAAQGFTLVCIVVGMVATMSNNKKSQT